MNMRNLKEFKEDMAKMDVELRNAKKNRTAAMNALHAAQANEDAILTRQRDLMLKYQSQP